MIIAIVGLPQAGKKTIFRLLTGIQAERAPTREGWPYGPAPVRDPRVDVLRDMYKPKRTRYAEFETGLAPDVADDSFGDVKWLEALRKADAIIHVVRAFAAPHVFHVKGRVDAIRDLRDMHANLVIADLALVETRLERMQKEGGRKAKTGPVEREEALLQRFRSHLEQELPLTSLELSDADRRSIVHLQLLTLKPLVVALNVDDDLRAASTAFATQVHQLEGQGMRVVMVSGAIEAEMVDLDEAGRQLFMQDLGLSEPASHRLSRAAYESLGLISFFTVGPDEVRAWPIPTGATAPEAAGKIHSDLERGFIRADTIRYEDLVHAGSEKIARQENRYRLNGKDYIVQDGDVLEIRFNV